MAATEKTKTDAKDRSWRSLGHAALMTLIVGAVTGAHELITTGEGYTLEGIGFAAASGAGIALSAWVRRRLEGSSKDGS